MRCSACHRKQACWLIGYNYCLFVHTFHCYYYVFVPNFFYHSFQLPQLELMSSYFNLFVVVVVVAEESPCCGGQLAQV